MGLAHEAAARITRAQGSLRLAVDITALILSCNTGKPPEKTHGTQALPSPVLNFPSMFCPNCRAEYRPGFVRCADCDVPLVAALAARDTAQPMNSGRMELLWEGDDLALHTSLLAELQAAGIHCFSQAMNTYPGVHGYDPFPIRPMTASGHQVAVLSSDLQVAQEILEKLLDQEPPNLELPAQLESSDAPFEASPTSEEEFAREIWAGDDEELTSFLRDALRENQIPLRSEKAGPQTKIYVQPSQEKRAREVVREVIDAVPPK